VLAWLAGKRRGKAILLPFQMAVLVGIAITYTVVGGDSLSAFAHTAGSHLPKWGFYLIFGGLQVLLSMVSRCSVSCTNKARSQCSL